MKVFRLPFCGSTIHEQGGGLERICMQKHEMKAIVMGFHKNVAFVWSSFSRVELMSQTS